MKNVPDIMAAAIALIENIQREDLNAIEEAAALQRLLNEFELTHQEICRCGWQVTQFGFQSVASQPA